jgi:demethylmenaquinone methyltransferase/2-methoxy-6-polyprenyl-1,4-benzoquinol methylase
VLLDHDGRRGTGDQLPQGEAKVKAVRAMFDAIAPRYDLVNRVMTFGMDVGWRRATVAGLGLSPGGVVLDIAAGTGDLCRELTVAGHAAVGVDLSWEMLAHARTAVPLVQADALRLPVRPAAADGATCGFALRNLADLPSFFGELARVVRPGGRIALLEVAEPTSPVLQRGHALYFTKVVPRIGAWLSDAEAYRYLPRSVAYLPGTAGLLAQLRDAGFSAVHRRTLSGGIAQLLTATCGRR